MKSLRVSPLWAHILLIAVNLIYGANFTIAKAIMPRFIQPFGFIFFRVAFSLLLYGVLYRCFFYESIDRKDLPRMFLCGIFGIALNQLMFFKGISLTSAVHGSLLMILTPIFTLLIASFVLKESLSAFKLIGTFLGFSGAIILIVTSAKTSHNSSAIGDFCVVINAISYAIYLVMVKPLMSRYQPMTVIFFNFLTGFVWVAIFGFEEALSMDFSAIPSIYYWNFGFVILGATFLVYLFNVMAMSSVSPAVVGSYIYLQPLFAILFAVLLSNEKLLISNIIAGISIIFGLWLIHRK